MKLLTRVVQLSCLPSKFELNAWVWHKISNETLDITEIKQHHISISHNINTTQLMILVISWRPTAMNWLLSLSMVLNFCHYCRTALMQSLIFHYYCMMSSLITCKVIYIYVLNQQVAGILLYFIIFTFSIFKSQLKHEGISYFKC